MDPIFGFSLFALTVFIVTVVAWKRGQAGWLYALISIGGGFVAVKVAAGVGASGLGAAFAGFAVPILALLVSLSSNTSQREATVSGAAGEYKKCPFCAEAVRKEAIRCKHCHSELSATAPQS